MADLGGRLLSAYAGLTGRLRLLARPVVALRRRAGKEHPTRWRERLGRTDAERPPGPVIWVHAASVGETVAVLPLAERLAAAGASVVLTTVTVTAAAVVAAKPRPGVLHQFAPLDVAPVIDRFLATFEPQLAIFVESEIWPVTLQRLAVRRIPLVLSNGRMSERSFRRWSRLPSLAHAIFSTITLCLAQSELDASRFTALGTGRIVVAGNIKFDAPVPEAARHEAAALAASIGQRPVFLAASTHAGEEEVVLDAFERLQQAMPDLLLLVAPRHPERGPEVMSMAVGRAFDVCQRSTGALPGPETSVYIADTLGELGTLYRLATVAFVGGSLVDRGGHNPIEPARLGAAVITGPHVGNFTDIYGELIAERGAVRIHDDAELADAVERLVHHLNERTRQLEVAEAVVARYSGALERTFAAVEPLVAPLLVAASLERPEAHP